MDKTSTSEITHTKSSKEYHKSVHSSFGKILPLLAKVTGQIFATTTQVMFCMIHACFQSLDGSHSSSGFPYSPQLNNTTASNIKRRSCLTSWHSVLYLIEFAQTLFLWYAVLRGLFEAYPCVTILPQIDFQWILQTNSHTFETSFTIVHISTVLPRQCCTETLQLTLF